ncbi:MAG TPA: hypothetical protein VMZ33_03300 [Candidatus Limnocylindrales bacterium]|nr:hypothetical protein [Candidatus Limnocylindrales bacterium]
MRRLIPALVVLLVLLLAPAAVSAHEISRSCVISVEPGTGGTRDIYRITGRHFPHEVNGGGLEVRIDVSRVVFDHHGSSHLEMKQILILFLIPTTHRFYVDFNAPEPGAVQPWLKPGHYVVAAQTPHQPGCRTVSGFDVRRFG